MYQQNYQSTLQVVNLNTLISLKQSGIYDQALSPLKILTSSRELQMTMNVKKKIEMKATQHTNQTDEYPELETTIANLEREQNSDPVIAKWSKECKLSLHLQQTPTIQEKSKSTSSSYEDFFTENGIFCKRYFAHDGKMLYKKLCVPKAVLKEVMYRIDNAPTGGNNENIWGIQKLLLLPKLCGVTCRLSEFVLNASERNKYHPKT